MEDEAVAQFVAVTDATPERAEQYIQLSDGNIERAIHLWYETGGIDMGDSVPSASTVAPSTSNAPPVPNHSRPRPDIVNLDSDDETGEDVQYMGESTRSGEAAQSVPNHSEDDDEAMARRLQEEMYAGETSQGSDPEGVRAPIARTTETLVGPEPYDLGNPADRAAAVAEQILLRQGRGMPESRRAAQGYGPSSRPSGQTPSIWDQSEDFSSQMRARAEQASSQDAEATRKSTMLAEMFRPPFEIMTRLAWDDARDEGKEKERWILVNVQDPSIFDCQLLNRDIWKHEGIRETVQEHFIFLQYNKDDPRGGQYIQYYFPHRDSDGAYPHIAIVDPRTGEQVKVWSGPPAPKPMDFLMQLHEFLDRYSLNATAKNPVARRKPDPPPQASRIEAMTEEEQLELAMQASLAQGEEAGPSRAAAATDPDDLTRSLPDLKANTADAASGTARAPRGDTPMPEAEPEPNNVASTHDPTFAAVASDRSHTEPAATDPGTTRIQFRHPEGRVVRRFLLADPVERLYEWLKAEPLAGLEGKEFALSFMGRNLLADVQEGKNIEGAGLRNGSVNVEVVEGE
jgi:UBX domain-containing protein 7